MLHFPRWKVLATLAVVLAGVVFAGSNDLPKQWQDAVRHLGGSVQISGQFTTAEANDLVGVLRSGAPPAPITFISMTTEPGADAVAKQQGL